MWENICRICSSPGDYEVFAKIPTYLHATSKEFLNWQKPIDVMLEETTGLKVSADDGLPRSICALCISYMKHAASFRDQAIRSAMSLKAVALLNEQQTPTIENGVPSKSSSDKEGQLITAQELSYAEGRQIDTKTILKNNTISGLQDQEKVSKQLLNNKFHAHPPSRQTIERHMRYLNLLFDKNTNAGLQHKYLKCETKDCVVAELDADEDNEAATSSDEPGEGDVVKSKDNIFSYREKNFEEDDIMDMEEVRGAVTVNIPESCKERKCRACFRRFMFEETYCEHMDTCIEYKFLTFNEEINNLLEIRRNKAVSPHEFIRRMIFCLRKTCEWLKANCFDMLLPDLLYSGNERAIADGKSCEVSLDEQKSRNGTADSASHASNKELVSAGATTPIAHRFFATPQPSMSSGAVTPTPISVQNNILYVIQRSQSRNSNSHIQEQETKHDNSKPLMKPIAVMARRTKTLTTTTTTTALGSRECGGGNSEERITFLKKLQKAATAPLTPATPQKKRTAIASVTPQISVRKDLLEPTTSPQLGSKSVQQPPLVPDVVKPANLAFSARCNPCNLYFDTLAALEVHNATHHNQPKVQQMKQAALPKGQKKNVAFADEPAEEARQRIIALFED